MELDKGIIIEKLDIKNGDILVVTFDTDVWDADAASEICRIISEIFPNNNVVATFKGLEINADAGSSPK